MIVFDGDVYLFSNPDHRKVKAGSLLPIPQEQLRALEEKPRLLIYAEDDETILQQARDLTDHELAKHEPKSSIVSLSSLQLTLKNLPKTMDLSTIYAEDLNILAYFDNVVSKSIADWKSAMAKNLKFKIFLKAFLQLLFKKNKEK